MFIFFLNKSSYILSFLYNYDGFLVFKLFNLDIITNFTPSDPYIFFLYYFNIFFYWLLLVWSFFKFVLNLQNEFLCRYIYNVYIDRQYILGSILFILSEFMLFFSFFWAFFHSSVSPSIFVGNCWPPVNIYVLNAWHIPFLNTVILVISGITVNWFFFTLQRLSILKNKIYKGVNTLDFIVFNSSGLWVNFHYYSIRSIRYNVFIFILNNFNYILKIFYFYFYLIFLSYFFILFFYLNFFYLNFLNFFNKSYFNLYYLCSYSVSLYKFFLNSLCIYLNFILYLNLDNSFNFILSLLDKFYFFKLHIIRSLEDIYISLILTVYLGVLFLGFQYSEYKYYATFGLDNIYGTVFYLLTSLHGAHVYAGLSLLLVCFSFLSNFSFDKALFNSNIYSNFFLVFAVWYWHFVDVVWLFLFIIVYIWGS